MLKVVIIGNCPQIVKQYLIQKNFQVVENKLDVDSLDIVILCKDYEKYVTLDKLKLFENTLTPIVLMYDVYVPLSTLKTVYVSSRDFKANLNDIEYVIYALREIDINNPKEFFDKKFNKVTHIHILGEFEIDIGYNGNSRILTFISLNFKQRKSLVSIGRVTTRKTIRLYFPFTKVFIYPENYFVENDLTKCIEMLLKLLKFNVEILY